MRRYATPLVGVALAGVSLWALGRELDRTGFAALPRQLVNAGVPLSSLIELAPGGRNWYVLAHELAHALGPSEHGIGFARVYHDLLNHRTFKTIMSTPRGQEFLEYLRVEHPRQVRRIYRRR